MLKMMIADDEQIILDGLSVSIDWQSYGIEVVGTASNGFEALEMAKTLRPDILMTDIRMPGLSGLELVRQIQDFLPWIKILLVSAYEQFEYAQQALSLGVMSYVTKPLKKQRILEEVIKVRDRVLEERRDRENKNHLEELYYSNLPILREHYHNNLIMGKTRLANDYSKQLDLYGIEICGENAGVFLCVIDNLEETSEEFFEKSVQIIHLRILEMIKEMLPAAYRRTVFQSYNNEVVTIYNASDEHVSTLWNITNTAEAIKNRMKSETGISVSFGVGRIYSSLREVALSYNEAVRALNYRLVYGNNAVIYIEDVEVKRVDQPHLFNDLNDILTNIQNILWTGKAEEVLAFIEKKVPWLSNCKSIPYYYIQQAYCQFLSILLRTIYEMDILQEHLQDMPVDLYEVLFKKQTLEELQEWYSDLVERVCRAIQEKKAVRTNNVIGIAIEYIKRNYFKDLSLSEVAEQVGLNPSYFSRLFKTETGIQFVEYVRNVKMEMAKELLRSSSKKIYEICEELGYQSVQYFSFMFKNTVGMTPMEYKRFGKY